MVLVQKEPKKIYMYQEPYTDYSAMRGPCPEGFHIPTKAQWVEVYNARIALGGGNKDATNFGIALKLPFAGYRNYDMTIRVVGSTGFYWTCEANSNSPTASYALDFSSIGSGNISTRSSYYRAPANSIRAFKDISVEPTASWTKMYGTSIESGGIFWDSINGLISISGDGSSWITMEDKNLGATTVWNGGDTLTDDNCGYFYQWGNNYGFAHSGAVSYSYNKVDASNYGPGNYYNDSTFRYISSAPNNWDSSDNLNLWGGVTGPIPGGGDIEVQKVYVGSTKVRPSYHPRTFTISRTEQSNMTSGWTYSDDAAGLTAGSGDFDDFFGYSAVLLNTSGVETAEMTQSGGVFTGAMTTLGNITSGDNVMIKFPVRGIKMTKSGSVVTLSITEELNKAGYQYYAHSTGTLDNPGTPKDAFYLGAYKAYNNSSVLKSWSGKSPAVNNHQPGFCTQAKANGSGYNIVGFYQRQYITALYMMKYGNPFSQRVIGKGYTSVVSTGGTNSQTNATYGTSSTSVQCKLFGLEDRWGSAYEFRGGARTDSNKQLCTSLSNWSGYASSGGEGTGTILNTTPGYPCLSSISGNNKAMFTPQGTVNSTYVNIYYSSMAELGTNQTAFTAGLNNYGGGIFIIKFGASNYTYDSYTGTRLMYMNGIS